MFKWLTNLVEGGRIAYAYLGYERECKKQWVADADRTYSTTHIEQDIKNRMADPQCHVASTFDASIRDLESTRENIQRVISEAKEKLAILERDYKSELDAAYKIQNEASEALAECRRKLSSAFDDLNSAKSILSSWYSRAEGNWLGNGGKQLPKHAFFGQDLSDRDRYKSRRDSASSDVGRYRSERSSIASRLENARATVKRIKDARQEMFDLKKAGFDKRIVTSVINRGNNDLRSTDDEIAELGKSRYDYIDRAKRERGIYALEDEIGRLLQEKVTCIKAFDSESAVLERKAKHRAVWLEARAK